MRSMQVCAAVALTLCLAGALSAAAVEYKVLATNKTSTMEKELNEAAAEGYVFSSVMGGETAFGGKEVVVVMVKVPADDAAGKRTYKLLATSRTSTMQKEMQKLGDEGFEYRGQTIFQSTFGGKEVSVIMERSAASADKPVTYKLLATSRTSTMQKELAEIGAEGYRLLGMTVASTAIGGSELVCILRKD